MIIIDKYVPGYSVTLRVSIAQTKLELDQTADHAGLLCHWGTKAQVVAEPDSKYIIAGSRIQSACQP